MYHYLIEGVEEVRAILSLHTCKSMFSPPPTLNSFIVVYIEVLYWAPHLYPPNHKTDLFMHF